MQERKTATATGKRKRRLRRSETSTTLPPEEQNPAAYLNRELSRLEFNRRVLSEAFDERTPLLERLRFLGIVTSNLNEFFMKRVGRMMRKVAAGIEAPSADGMTSSEQLQAIRESVIELQKEQARCFQDHLLPALFEKDIHLLRWSDLGEEEQISARHHFRANIFSALTPLAVDPGHPFPFISNLSKSFGLTVRHPDREETLFARLKIPRTFAQWIPISGARGLYRFISLEELIRENLQDVFPGMVLMGMMTFRVTRSAEPELDEEEAEDIRELIEQELHYRRFARVVRLEHGPEPIPETLNLLIEELEIKEREVYEVAGELDYTSLSAIAELNLPQLKFRPLLPSIPPALAEEDANVFSAMRAQDILVHHPFESFISTVEKFLRQAVFDPKVVAIKMTVYRIGDNSAFMPLLIEAARTGKQVVCIVELSASFDEERNIFWARELEKAGVHVVYGLIGFKTHAKTILVVRQESEGLRCYGHIGTGNYQAATAGNYTDIGLFTADSQITEDLVEFFHALTGRSLKSDYRRLLVAPVNLRERLLQLIEAEAEAARQGMPAGIVAKFNGLDEHTVCRALYKASQAGVKIELIVRGLCTLRPGLPGLSESITVVSTVGRFLEHSRIFHFRNRAENPADGCFFIGSADWMYRNLLARVELLTPVVDPSLRKRLWEILQLYLSDERQSWSMKADGSYVQRKAASDQNGVQEKLISRELRAIVQ